MVYLFLAVLVACCLQFCHRRTSIILCFATLLSACLVGGSSTMPPLHIPQEQVREVCWQTQAEADIEAVTNKESGWLKRAFTSDPGTLEEVQHRLANTLNSIQAPPVFDDPELDRIALLGFDAGFDNGKFEVKAKLLAIDAGVMLIEFAAMEVALGPLGGAKLEAIL